MASKVGSRTVTVVRQPKVDRYSDAPRPAATEIQIKGCAILPRASFEQGKGWVTVEGFQVIAPHDADVTSDDQVRIEPGGPLWSVDGEPGDFEDRKGKGKATIFYLSRVS